MTYVLDASALLRYLLAEAGTGRVRQIILLASSGAARVIISAVKWAEVVAKVAKILGREHAKTIGASLFDLGLECIPVTTARASRAAFLVLDYKLAYADAFCAELALNTADHTLVTADFDFKLVESLFPIEFLPTKALLQ